MPVLNNDSHELTKRASDHPYGCFDHITKDYYFLDVRSFNQRGQYSIGQAVVDHRMSRECRYDKSLSDTRCTGCIHQGSGETYDAQIRSNGN